MYNTYIPVTVKTLNLYSAEKYIEILKKTGTDTVFLCPASDINLWNNYNKELSDIKKYTAEFHNNGFKVGVWIWTFMYPQKSDYTYMVGVKGEVSKSNVCPTDTGYRKLTGKFIKDCAAIGIDLFMFDDDYRYAFIDIGFGCLCKNHLKLIENILNEPVTAEKIRPYLLKGGKNKYRTAFIKANGEALEDFAVSMRNELDKINPDVRMGFCSCISSWDIDGTTPDKIAERLAGKTKPFYRLIGAPYWANERIWGNRLSDVIELERSEAQRRKNNDIEIFTEADTYPRPRYKVPSSYLEIFDTAMRVAGCTDGILKYMTDYSASPEYEKGYIESHIKNRTLYSQIEKMFNGKTSVGIKIWDNPEKYKTYFIPEKYENDLKVQELPFSYSSKLACYCSLPSVYGYSDSTGVAFGDDILAVPQNKLNSGIIIDVRAAEILKQSGTDTGLISTGKTVTPEYEYFKNYNELVGVPFCEITETEINNNAVTESVFKVNENTYPASYRYENSEGQKFFVLCFDAYFNNESLLRQYTRQKQIIDCSEWLSGKKIPAVCKNNPDLYIQVKRNNTSTAVALWNIFPDKIAEPEVELDFTPSKITDTINCIAEICGNKVKLSEITPYDFCAFEVI